MTIKDILGLATPLVPTTRRRGAGITALVAVLVLAPAFDASAGAKPPNNFSRPDVDELSLCDAASSWVLVPPGTSGPSTVDTDGDGILNTCDSCPDDPTNDIDGDEVCGASDTCPGIADEDQLDT